MTNAELIACIQAEEQGQKIEYACKGGGWVAKTHKYWDCHSFDYRIAREPRKCWVCWSEDGVPDVVSHSGSPTENLPGWQLVVEDVK